MDQVKIISIKNHKTEENETYIEHSATVRATGNFSNKELLTAVTDQLDYPTKENGFFHFGADLIDKNTYYVEWETEK